MGWRIMLLKMMYFNAIRTGDYTKASAIGEKIWACMSPEQWNDWAGCGS